MRCWSGRTRRVRSRGEWRQQATLAIRARVPLDTIQPFPAFTEIYVTALDALNV